MADIQDSRYQALAFAVAYPGNETLDKTMERATKYAQFLEAEVPVTPK